MFHERIDLYEYFGLQRPENGLGYLTTYAPKPSGEKRLKKRPAMLVHPGGGYHKVCDREKAPVAFQYLAASYATFVLEYSVAPVAHPYPLLESAMAMIYIRENAEKFQVDTAHVAAWGGSAGGHACLALGTLFDEPILKEFLGEKVALVRPDAVVLAYPVVTADKNFWHEGSIKNISGGDEELAKRLSLETRINETSAPAFIWHTVADELVPVENSLMLATAYKKAGVAFELHLFEQGWHGASTATEEVNTPDEALQAWIPLSLTWLKKHGFGLVF